MNDKLPVKSSTAWKQFSSHLPGASRNRFKLSDMKKSLYIYGYPKAFVFLFVIFSFLFMQANAATAMLVTTAFHPENTSDNQSKYPDLYKLQTTSGKTIFFAGSKSSPLVSAKYQYAEYSAKNEIGNNVINLLLIQKTDSSGNILIPLLPSPGTIMAPPTITCPGPIAQAAAPGVCNALVSGLAAVYTDPDSDVTTLTWAMTGATVAASPLFGINNILTPKNFNVGITTVSYIVTDAGGSSDNCNFTITVTDTQLPIITTCPANINATYLEGACNANVSVIAPGANDNCGAALVNGIRSDGLALNAVYPAGVTTITWTATDIHGNVSLPCTQTVRVTQGDLLVNYNFTGATSYPIAPNVSATGITCEATSSEAFNILSTLGTTTGNLAFVNNAIANPAIYMDPSNYINVRYFQFHINGDSLYKYRKFKLYVQARRGNRAAQTINFAYSSDPVSYTVNGAMSLISSGVWYEKVVDWSNVPLINNRSDLYIRLFASNAAGGAGDQRLFIDNFQVIGVDGPLARPNSATIDENTPVNIPALGNDSYGCNGPAAVTPISITSYPAQGNVVLNPDGTFTYTPNANVNGNDSFIYQICDASGSCDTSIVNITITPVNYPPTVNCPGPVNSGSDVGYCGAVVNDLAATPFDLDGNITTLTWTITGANNDASPLFGINQIPQGYFFNFGISTIKYIVTDADNLSAFCTFTVNVEDSEDPSRICPNDTTITIPYCAFITDPVTLNAPIVNDNCAPPLPTTTNNAPAQFPIGNTTVLWTITDIHGLNSYCEQIVTVVQAPEFTVTMSSSPVNCFGWNDGTATATPSGGSPPYLYLWNTVPPQTTQTASFLFPGTYTVIVTDFAGCVATDSVTITEPATKLSASKIITNVVCFGDPTGSVTITGNGGTPPYQYSIDGGPFQASGTFSNLPAGFYVVVVRDANNCIIEVPVIITGPADELIASATSPTGVACTGQNNGIAIATATGGTQPYTYLWNTVPAQANDTAINLPAGTYTVTVTDANGCEDPATVTISPPASQLFANITDPVNACFGQATGTAIVIPSGGLPPYTFSWNTIPVQTNDTAINLAPGTYTATVTDANGCTATDIVTISEAASALSASYTTIDVLCFGDLTGSVTVTGTGGTPPYQYSIDGVTFQPGGSFPNLPAGSYTVTVKDANNCTFDVPFTISEPASALVASATSPTGVSCFGQSNGIAIATATGGTSPYTFSWNTVPVQTNDTATNLPAGTYIVTVFDASGCQDTASIVITASATELIATVTGTDVVCFGQADGTAIVSTIGGIPPYSYVWNTIPVQTNDTITGLTPGTYEVIVTDAGGCSDTASVIITQPALALDGSITNIVQEDCVGNANGSVTITATGGTPAYQYSIDGITFQASGTFGSLSAGSYIVTVQDANNCSDTVHFNITVSGILIANDDYYSTPVNTPLTNNVITNDLGLCYPPVTVTSNTSPANGSVVVQPDGSFTYTPNLDYVGNDFFAYTITDFNGIDSTAIVYITINPVNSPPATVNEIISLCQGTTFTGTALNGGTVFNGDTDPENNLPLTINPTPVIGPSHGVFTFTDLVTGTFDYTPDVAYYGLDIVVVNICDSGIPTECSNDTIFIDVKQLIAADAGQSQMLCNADVTSLVGNNPAPGTGTWAFVSGPNIPVIFPPTGSSANVTGMIASVVPYVFSYTIATADGCISTDTMRVINYNPPTQAYAGMDQNICDASVSITVTLEGNISVFGTGDWTQLSGPNAAIIADTANPTSTVSGLIPGIYTFQWTISNGICQVSDAVVNITISAPVTAYSGLSETICEGSAYPLSGASASGYTSLQWTTSGTGSFNDSSLLQPVYIPSAGDITTGSVNLTLTAYATFPCSDQNSVMTLTIIRNPLAYGGPNDSICQGATYTLTAATAENYSSILWTTTGAGTLTNDNSIHANYTPSAGETGVITMTLTVTGNTPCGGSVSSDMLLTIIAAPVANAGPDAATCEGAAFTVTNALASNNTSLVWTTTGTGTFDNNTILLPVYSPSVSDLNIGSVQLKLTATGSTPCPPSEDQMTLIINGYPTALAVPDAEVCQGVPFIVSGATATNYSSIQWTSTGEGILTNATTLNPTYTPAAGETGTINLIITVHGNPGCGSATSNAIMALNIKQGIVADAGADKTIPQNTATTLQGSATGGSGQYQYNWIPGNLLTFENTDHPTTMTLTEETQFVLIVSDQVSGCQDSDTVKVFVSPGGNQPPVAVDDYDTTNFNAPVNIPILNNDSDPENGILTVAICGFPANGFLNLNNDGSATYSPYTDFSGDDEFCYFICDNGTPALCDTAAVFIHVNPKASLEDIFVYNGFSPNGDGNNDHLVIRGIEGFPDNEIEFFNRYGDKIRALSHYDNHDVFWDGKNIDGKPVPDGTYFYILKINDAAPRTGWIFIRGKK